MANYRAIADGFLSTAYNDNLDAVITAAEQAVSALKTLQTARDEKRAERKKAGLQPDWEEVVDKAVKVKLALGTAEAKKIINEVGKAEKLVEIPPFNFAAFVAACDETLGRTHAQN